IADTVALGNVELGPWQVDRTGNVALLECCPRTHVDDPGTLFGKFGELVCIDDDGVTGFLRSSGNAEHGVLRAGADSRHGNSERDDGKRTCCKKTTGGYKTHRGNSGEE